MCWWNPTGTQNVSLGPLKWIFTFTSCHSNHLWLITGLTMLVISLNRLCSKGYAHLMACGVQIILCRIPWHEVQKGNFTVESSVERAILHSHLLITPSWLECRYREGEKAAKRFSVTLSSVIIFTSSLLLALLFLSLPFLFSSSSFYLPPVPLIALPHIIIICSYKSRNHRK